MFYLLAMRLIVLFVAQWNMCGMIKPQQATTFIRQSKFDAKNNTQLFDS